MSEHPITAEVRNRLHAAFPEAQLLQVIDDSAKHAGHAGASGGAGHFQVLLVSTKLRGLNRLARHRLVYDPLADLMPAKIHALSVQAFTPDERSGSGLV